jgi:hypothetical protein
LEGNGGVPRMAAVGEGRLTRAAFSKTLQTSQGQTLFDIRGLSRLKHTFSTLDGGGSETTTTTTTTAQHGQTQDACQLLFEEADATDQYDPTWLPDAPNREYSELLSQPKEFYGDDFLRHGNCCSKEQVAMLKRDRNQFTAAEDSLVFRGVVSSVMCVCVRSFV